MAYVVEQTNEEVGRYNIYIEDANTDVNGQLFLTKTLIGNYTEAELQERRDYFEGRAAEINSLLVALKSAQGE